jgi:hypothetical protein
MPDRFFWGCCKHAAPPSPPIRPKAESTQCGGRVLAARLDDKPVNSDYCTIECYSSIDKMKLA